MEGIVIISKGKISAQTAAAALAALYFKRKQQKEKIEGGDETSGQPPALTLITNHLILR